MGCRMRSGERGVRCQDGYTLVGLMVAVAVINIALGVAVTSWTTLDRRAREAELLWRGQQIGKAIACYAGSQPTEPLTKLDQLVQANCLRRLYDDPMVKDGQWRILTERDVADGTVAALTGQAAPGLEGDGEEPDEPGEAGTALGSTGLGLSRLFQRSGPGGPGEPRGGLGALSGGNAIVGVVSRATGASLRTWGGRQKYGEWVFLAGGAPPAAGGVPSAAGASGGAGAVAPDAPRRPQR